MASSNQYEFVTEWRVVGSPAEVARVLEDGTDLPRWWPEVYLGAVEVEPGEPRTRVGRVIALHTRGWLPYTLRWSFRIEENRLPEGFSIRAWGDFDGTGVWTLRDVGGGRTHVRFEWKIVAEKPLLKYLSFLMKPLFRANHEWAMRRGEESLVRELERRRATLATVARVHEVVERTV
jgi:hypothetical protein